MPPIPRLRPEEVVARRDLLVIDVRRAEERYSDIGWIPGSRWVPEPEGPDALQTTDGRQVVLACMSGRRSLEIAEHLVEAGLEGPIADLRGGILHWGAAGLPVCRPQAAQGERPSPQRLRKMIRSCFLVESMESGGLDESIAQRALDTFSAAFPDHVELERGEVERRIDQLAEMAWVYGHRVEAIARNVESFYAAAAALG